MKDKERMILELRAKGLSAERAYDEASYGKAVSPQAKCNIVRRIEERHKKVLEKVKSDAEKVNAVKVSLAFEDAKQVIEAILLSGEKDSDRIAAFRELCKVNGWGEPEKVDQTVHLSDSLISGIIRRHLVKND